MNFALLSKSAVTTSAAEKVVAVKGDGMAVKSGVRAGARSYKYM